MNDMCPSCGQSISADAPTCIYCGTTLGPATPGARVSTPVPAALGSDDILLDDEAIPPLPELVDIAPPPPPAARKQAHAMSHAATMQAQALAAAPPPPPALALEGEPAGIASGASMPGLQLGSADQGGAMSDPGGLSLDGPGLELASDRPPPRSSMAGDPTAGKQPAEGAEDAAPLAPESVPPPAQTPQDRKRARIESVAGYGPVPTSPLYFAPYFVKVFMRKRVVTQELLQLTKVRKRASQAHVDAMCQVGESLHVRRTDPTLAPLARQFEVISSADSAIDEQAEAGAASRDDALRELDALARRVEAIEVQLKPVQQRMEGLEQQAGTLTRKMTEAEQAATKIDAEIVRINALETPTGEDRARVQQMAAQREQVSQVMARIDAELSPRRQEIDALRGKFNKQRRAADELIGERDSLSEIMGRERDRQAVEAGASRGALREALKALAEVAIEQGLTDQVTALVEKVEKLEAELKRKRQHEGVYRAALSSYDEKAYKQGGIVLVGGTGLVMFSLLVMIFL